jgi:hypothetical protein
MIGAFSDLFSCLRFVRDIKRRDTRAYLICTAGADGLLLWSLDPYSGELDSAKITGDSRAAVSR